ncbi:hypothetical protein BV133_1773 [Blastochloris viridis]|uniref:Uncharacterized protein n=1 Tax=Blastochloris viridis TaxID=1079 RepID=A0A182D1G8_BLAVI|nr:hypothetical protein BV133_1773 [Blastochloris viridis]
MRHQGSFGAGNVDMWGWEEARDSPRSSRRPRGRRRGRGAAAEGPGATRPSVALVSWRPAGCATRPAVRVSKRSLRTERS